jgi:hypothetical protein
MKPNCPSGAPAPDAIIWETYTAGILPPSGTPFFQLVTTHPASLSAMFEKVGPQ